MKNLHADYGVPCLLFIANGYGDFLSAYGMVLPAKRHRVVGKESEKTNHTERLNCTFQQRIS